MNVTYGSAINFNGGIDTLKMDIYLPDCDDITHTSKRPLLMLIHGGSFLAGDKNDVSIQASCKEFAKRGYVTASIDYRLGFISDDLNWQCNYPNYSCVFATDSAEWARAYYRAVQDGKGALRYLVNRYEDYRIDTNNVFVGGESAGAFTALGIGLLDTISERPPQTYHISSAPIPNASSFDCMHNQGIIFTEDSISRPDLGEIEGNIEPTDIDFTIKGIGNMYGAMMTDLLVNHPENKPKPAIYSFHQACDIIVPIDSNYVDWGISWCFTNGYNCYGVSNNEIMLYGSRAFSNWNTLNNYGYNIQDEFTTINFPYNFLFGEGSCLDQVDNPCHAYDNKAIQEENLALFFSELITTNPICDTIAITSINELDLNNITIYPNPSNNKIQLSNIRSREVKKITLIDSMGRAVFSKNEFIEEELMIDLSTFSSGIYLLIITNTSGYNKNYKILKK